MFKLFSLRVRLSVNRIMRWAIVCAVVYSTIVFVQAAVEPRNVEQENPVEQKQPKQEPSVLLKDRRIGDYDFSKYYDLVYQIRVVSPKAGSKSSIGSGFQVSDSGLIITNYHVIASFVQSPGNHIIEYRAHNGELGKLELIDFDVINDLAVLQHSNPSPSYFAFSQNTLRKGETVFALGNPLDFGMSLVPGPNNGFVEHSYNDQILFSGSLNSGMSGGPALNHKGEVVGVNVATAGSQLSFLVPSKKALALVDAARVVSPSEYQLELSNQIKRWQRPRIQDLIDREWSIENFADAPLFGEIRKDFQCWGGTNEDNKERKIEYISKSCRAGNSVYLDSNLDAGRLSFSFSKRRSLKLNALQFSQSIHSSLQADNYSNFENSSNYRCHVNFLENSDAQPSSDDSYNRVTTCIRSYKKWPGLYDSLLLVERNSNREAFNTHLSVSALEQDQLLKLNQKFIEHSL